MAAHTEPGGWGGARRFTGSHPHPHSPSPRSLLQEEARREQVRLWDWEEPGFSLGLIASFIRLGKLRNFPSLSVLMRKTGTCLLPLRGCQDECAGTQPVLTQSLGRHRGVSTRLHCYYSVWWLCVKGEVAFDELSCLGQCRRFLPGSLLFLILRYKIYIVSPRG